jgi:hypothetical protein
MAGAPVRPLSFTVRFRMHRPHALLLTALGMLGSNSLPAQTATPVHIHVSAPGSCLIDSISVPCSDVGAKLRELGTPLGNVHIHLSVAKHLSYDATSAAIDSLRDSASRAGYTLQLGQINVQPQ